MDETLHTAAGPASSRGTGSRTVASVISDNDMKGPNSWSTPCN